MLLVRHIWSCAPRMAARDLRMYSTPYRHTCIAQHLDTGVGGEQPIRDRTHAPTYWRTDSHVTMFAACILLTLALAAGALAAAGARALRRPPRPPLPNSVGIMLGSGGHTAEMLQLIQTLPHDEFYPRVYLVSEGDVHSLTRARALEGELAAHPLQALVLPRARAVGQSWLSTPFTVVWSTIYTIWALATRPVWLGARRPRVDVLLMNGPATCVPLCIAVWCLRVRWCMLTRLPGRHRQLWYTSSRLPVCIPFRLLRALCGTWSIASSCSGQQPIRMQYVQVFLCSSCHLRH